MERMESTLTSVVPTLLQNKTSSKTVSVGPIAVKLLECVKAFHERNTIVLDVKTDNFMLAPGAGIGRTLEMKLASRIRLIDLGLVEQCSGVGESKGMVGTPLYASLNVHANKRVSYRNDLEAVGYVIAELLTKLSSGDMSRTLPWSHAKSDDEIGNMKRAMVEDSGSLFYQQLGDEKTISIFSKYLTMVRGYSLKDKPDYEELEAILSKLVVPTAKVKSVEKASGKKSPRRSSVRKAASEGAEHPESGTKRGRSSKTVATQTPLKMARHGSGNMDVDDEEEDVQAMDWEATNENVEPEGGDQKPKARPKCEPVKRRGKVIIDERNSRRPKKKSQPEVVTLDESEDDEADDGVAKMPARLQRRGVMVSVVAGPHRGESFMIEDGGTEVFVLGSNPSTKVGKTFALKDDGALSATHVRLDLYLKKGMRPGLSVTSKSKEKVYIDSNPVTNTKAFIGNLIHIGNTTLKLEAL